MSRSLKLYLAALALFTLGMHLHVVLFNLYLADLGIREDGMGRLVGAMTLGTALGIIPAAALARRLGLRRVVAASAAGLALSMCLRALVLDSPLLAASFFEGLFLAGCFVTIGPAIAALTKEGPQRAASFSLSTALGIGTGAAAGVLAGVLPRLWSGAGAAASKRAVLLVAAALVAAAAALATGVRMNATASPARGTLRWNPFLARYLVAVAFWYAFANGILPFFNIFLRNRVGASLDTIGALFSVSQLVQAAAALAAAPLISRFGLARPIVGAQILAAVTLVALAPVRALGPAAALYLTALSLYVMTEPALQNLLMSEVAPEQREAAAAANLLTMFLVQSVAATAAGRVIASRGYGPLFIAVAMAGAISALLFALLFGRASRSESVPAASAPQSPAAPGA